MKAVSSAAVLAILATSTVFAADGTLLSLAPPDTRMVAGIYVDRTRNTPFGQFVLAQMKEEDPNLKLFIESTGFDPRHDLNEVLIVSKSASSRSKNGLILARGIFNGPQIIAAGKAKGAISSLYKNVELLSHTGSDKGALAVMDGSVAIAGDLTSVKAAIDQRKGQSLLETRLSAKVTQVSGQYDAWFAAIGFAAPVGSNAQTPGRPGQLGAASLQSIEQTSGGVKFGSVVQVSGEAVTRSDKDAQSLVDVTRFLAGLITMNKDGSPETANLAALAQSLDVKADGNTVRLSFSMAESDLERLVQPKLTRRASIR